MNQLSNFWYRVLKKSDISGDEFVHHDKSSAKMAKG